MTSRQPASGFRHTVLAIALAAVCVVALTGCGNGNGNGAGNDNGNGSEPPVSDAVIVDGVDCQASNQFESWGLPPETPVPEQTAAAHTDPEQTQPARPAPDRGRVPAGFDAVAATLCTLAFEPFVMNETGATSVTATRFEGDLEPLLAALSLPNDSPGINQLCTADLELVPELWLEDADGHAIRAAWPLTACNKTKRPAREALDGLTQTSTQTFRYAAAPESMLPQLAQEGSEIDWSEMGVLVDPDDVEMLPTTQQPQ